MPVYDKRGEGKPTHPQRVMKEFFFVLLRYALRVDGVLVRVRGLPRRFLVALPTISIAAVHHAPDLLSALL